ncbi:MAG: glycerophosphodiester phosphodiesterase [Candidatus Lokiarchaeia archaeon]
MKYFEIIAHRGVPTKAPENSMEAFQHAIKVGADGIEFDVRLTADRVPIIYHYFYLDEFTNGSGPIFDFTFDQIQNIRLLSNQIQKTLIYKISTLEVVLEKIGGQIGLEIEIKGPEPESAEIIGEILNHYKHLFDKIEVTSYEPVLLRLVQECCPGIITDLLFPYSEKWMKSDVIAYLAIQRARLARARAIHLHPTQLLPEIVSTIRKKGIQIHAWDVNDEESLKKVVKLDINRICTDNFTQAFDFRKEPINNT